MVAPSSLAELQRLLQNVIRLGTVAEVDHTGVRCRVRSGELLTTWLVWLETRAGDVRTWSPPSVGEQCVLLSPGGDLGAAVVLPGINSTAAPAPSSDPAVTCTHYPDGAVTSYDHSNHALTVTLPGGGTVHLTSPASVTVTSPEVTVEAAQVTIDALQTTCTGGLLVQGLLAFVGGASGRGGSGGGPSLFVEGGGRFTDDVIAAGVSVAEHPHPNIRRGGEMSDPPQATVT